MANILVLGGAGYIGSHTSKVLKQAGHNPICFDNISLGHRSFVRWGDLVHGDIRDTHLLSETMRSHAIDAVIHFAAFAYVGESVTNPGKYYNNNVAGTVSVLEAMRAAGVSKIVFSSTCAVYEDNQTGRISESDRVGPINPYGRSKWMCEQIISDYSVYGIESVALRYFNASGASTDSEIGELREIETHLIPRCMMWLQGYVDDFQVFGSDFPTTDGTAVRDYIHVTDLATAHLQALEFLTPRTGHHVYNLGTGAGYSVQEVLTAISKATGRHIDPVQSGRRQGDPASLVANADRARHDLGFSPRLSDLSTIIDTAWKWHQVAHPRR